MKRWNYINKTFRNQRFSLSSFSLPRQLNKPSPSAESADKQQPVQKKEKALSTQKQIYQLLKPYIYAPGNKRYFMYAFGLMFFSKGFAAASPYCLKVGVNALSSPATLNWALSAVVGFALFRFLSTLFHELRQNMLIKGLQETLTSLSVDIFKHMHSLDLSFHKQSTRNTIFAINKAINGVDGGYRFILGFIGPTLLEFSLLSTMIFCYCGPKYLINIFAIVAAYTAFSRKMSTFRVEEMRVKRDCENRAEVFLSESLLNMETARFFTREQQEIQKYHDINRELNQANLKLQYSLSGLNSGQQFILAAGILGNLIMAGLDVSHGLLTPGDFVMLQSVFLQIAQPLFFMGTVFRQLDESSINIEGLLQITKREPSVKEKENAEDYISKGGALELRNVNYQYEKDTENLFTDLTLSLEAGSTNAIVGPSGFGKSTLFNMIYRIFDPQSGEITLDGQNLKDLKLDSFRKKITIVPQNGILFNDTIANNLRFAREDASQEELEEICRRCNIHDTIMAFPEGYETVVGDMGSSLSGGERQRILIARAMLKKEADLVLLDEATSSLDSHNEHLITQELKEAFKAKTVIYCAHRLSSIMHVDKIFVLGEGRVLEIGTHEELLQRPDSRYYKLWQEYLQQQEEDDLPAE